MILKQMGNYQYICGILLPALFNAYGIFFISSVLPELPVEPEEAAKLDGCSTFTECFLQLYFYLSRLLFPLCIAFFWETEQLLMAADC